MKLQVQVHRKKLNLTLQTGHQTPITDITYYTDLKDFHFLLLMQGTFHKLLHTIHIPTVIQIIFLTRLHLNLYFYNTKCHRVAYLLLQLKKNHHFSLPTYLDVQSYGKWFCSNNCCYIFTTEFSIGLFMVTPGIH